MTTRQKTLAAWDGFAPDWVLVMADRCDQTSQRAVAERIGYSPASVNRILKNKWSADLTAVERMVRGAFMAATVICPVQGEIGTDACSANQELPFAATNNMRVRLYRACRGGCQHSRIDHADARI